jgi:hypothetical protein
MAGMNIRNVSELIAQCWNSAEGALQKAIESKYHDLNEEVITELFRGELRATLEQASSNGTVARAFLADLKSAFPRIAQSDLSRISHGLIATVNFHSKSVEKRTGGDFGLVLVRPDVSRARYGGSELVIHDDHQRGLLCQAKILRRNGTWGGLTHKQKQLLTGRMAYSGLVLYHYLDSSERRRLAEFDWQITAGNSLDDVSLWLKAGQFPTLQKSVQIIRSLARDRIGTDDKAIIAELIAPPTRPSLEIQVRWRDGEAPGPVVRTQVHSSVQQHVIVRQ